METLVLTYSTSSIEECIAYARANRAVLISLTPESDAALISKKVSHKTLGDYAISKIPYDELYRKRLALWNSWGKIKVSGRTISDELTMDGIRLWDSVENEAGEVNLEFIMLYCDCVLRIIEKEKPKRIVSQDMRNLYLIPRERVFFPDLLRQICLRRCIELRLLGSARVESVLQKPAELSIHAFSQVRKLQRRLKKPLRGQTDVLFMVYGTGMDKTGAVQQSLIDKGVSAATICSGGLFDRSGSYLEQHGHRYAYIESYLTPTIRTSAKTYAKDVAMLWQRIPKEKFRYQYIDLYPTFRHQFEYLFRRRIPESAELVKLFNRAYDKLSPKLVVTTNDAPFFARVAVQVAQRRGIPTLLMQHANWLDVATVNNPLSDYVATWYQEKDAGKRLIRTGTTKYESIRQGVSRVDRSKVFSELKIPDKKLILFAGRYPIMRDLQRIRDVESIASSLDCFAVIKMHPAETPLTPKMITNLVPSKNIMVLRDYDFIRLLSASDLVITTDECTTSTDAVMAGKPTILVDYESGFDMPLQRYGTSKLPCVRAKSLDDLKRQVREQLLDEHKRQELIEREESYNRKVYAGDAVANLVKLIRKIISGNRRL
jgi:UDP-N-acetylglucosamine:LPS N-acetylglucosamine transferase